MKILWFTWKDTTHPLSGGAEALNEQVATELAQQGHTIQFVVGGYKECAPFESRDGFTVTRLGNRYSVYLHAFWYYQKNLQGWADVVIEEINTIPFMTQWYVKEKRVLLFYQLCREIWFYQIHPLLGAIGYIFEPIYLWLMRNNMVLTESESTATDLLHYGFKRKNIKVFPVIIDQSEKERELPRKEEKFTLLSLGSVRPMKRTLNQVQAFEIAKRDVPNLVMHLAGNTTGAYGKQVLAHIDKSPYKSDIHVHGKVNKDTKKHLMRISHLLLVTSVKEGWGLVVTEAGLQGTPAIVYDVDGLRDSVEDGRTGLIVKPTPEEMAKAIVKIHRHPDLYHSLQKHTITKSETYTVDSCINTFLEAIS